MKCLYHDNCIDGFAAALLLKQRYPVIDLIPVNKTTPPPAIDLGECVFIVDFTYPPEVLVNHFKDASEVVVIDHHSVMMQQINTYFESHRVPDNLMLVLDTVHSGSMLVWRYLNRDKTPPLWLEYIEDHHLRSHPELSDSPAFNKWLNTLTREVTIWLTYLNETYRYPEYIAQGETLLKLSTTLVPANLTPTVR